MYAGNQNSNITPAVTVPCCNGVMHSEPTGETNLRGNSGQRASDDIHIELIAAGNEPQVRPDANQQHQVIELSDDDDDDDVAEVPIPPPPPDNQTAAMWHYVDPRGQTQGPFSLIALRRWSEALYFPPDFTVWRSDQTQNEAELLSDVLARNFPSG